MKRLPVSPWHAERGCVPGGFCRVWGKRHPRTTTQAARSSLPSAKPADD